MATGYLRATTSAPAVPSPTGAVDDLIKYRLVESMLRQPDCASTAQTLAAKLGFHSVELTGMALDEMVASGLLRATRRGGELDYALSPDPVLRAELADLVAAGPPGLFNRLAAASASRIRKLLRKRR